MVLPVGDGLRVVVIDGGDRAFACGAEALQFLVEQVAVGAVVRVAFVAEGEEVVVGVGESPVVLAMRMRVLPPSIFSGWCACQASRLSARVLRLAARWLARISACPPWLA